ncbi:hypothetical protein LRP79_26715 [Burkholderia pseudomallei]|uniref:hypothetical protein n=1 Tax=Burkholderia pseudomallei TaxID=28450 RepID=UPI001C808330|nr:hypothetical protein [Burkholderia pseudomallei]MCD4547715.1 hypothetical protein [Burkholderia pseudomallei]
MTQTDSFNNQERKNEVQRNPSCRGGVHVRCYVYPTSMAAESAEELYKQCEAKQTTAEQRECYPVVAKQSEIQLVAAERKARTAMVELENESEGSRVRISVISNCREQSRVGLLRFREWRRPCLLQNNHRDESRADQAVDGPVNPLRRIAHARKPGGRGVNSLDKKIGSPSGQWA